MARNTKPKVGDKFYPLTPAVAQRLRDAKLTAAEWRIWSYLALIDPWGDRYQEYEPLEVWTECECSKATFYRAIAKFQEIQLFDFQFRGASLKNETGVSKMRPKSQKCDSSLKNETEVSKMRPKSQNSDFSDLEAPEDETPSDPQTIQTYSDFLHTLSEEGGSFKAYCSRRLESIRFPIASPKAWLDAHWPEYWEEFQRAYPKEAKNSAKDLNAPGEVDVKVKIIEEAIAAGELQDYQVTPDYQKDPRGKVKRYLVRLPDGTLEEFENWRAGLAPAVAGRWKQMSAISAAIAAGELKAWKVEGSSYRVQLPNGEWVGFEEWEAIDG